FLYYRTDKDSEFLYLMRYELSTGKHEKLLSADWDIVGASLSKHGKYLVISINNDARTELRVYDAATLTPIDLPQLPEAAISSVKIAATEDRGAFYASSSKMPRDLFVYDFSGEEPTRLTRSLNPNIDPEDLLEGQVVRFASYDDLEIPGILYLPLQASENVLVPALVWVHGGPGGQSRVGYSALIQYLVNHRYAIYAINNRGSSGYGKTFYHLDDRKHGDVDLRDVVESKQMLIETGQIDPQRIGIIGGSYGGYMVLAALAFQPDVFDVGVDIFGVSNWVRTLQSIPPWWESHRKALEQEMGDFDDEVFLRAKSPLFHTEHIVKPLMVLQGANDPRVLKVESDEIVEAVQARGIPVEYVVFEDEGHGFVKKENQIRGYKAILDFVETHLK
ncbi:MAG: alpha/beta fold hydrolase, partial [Cyanobacteria bacterium J06607_6]